MKKLSVIMPVYNGERYLDVSIPSILNQKGLSKDDMELILINDGSKDDSITALRKYAKEFPDTISLIDRENKGAAASRNEGVVIAKGEYVTFFDQDDSVDEDYVRTLLDATNNDDVDIVHSGFKLVSGDGVVHKTIFPKSGRFAPLLSIPAWAKIYRRSFLLSNNIAFFENNIGEDNVFTLGAFLSNPRYVIIRYAGYNNAFDNQYSVTNSLHKGLSESVRILELLKELNKGKSDDKTVQRMIEYNTIRTASYYLLSYGKYASPERFTNETNRLFDWISTSIPKWSSNRFIWFAPKGESLSATLGVKFLVILYILKAVPLFAKLYCREDTK